MTQMQQKAEDTYALAVREGALLPEMTIDEKVAWYEKLLETDGEDIL